MKNNTSSFAKKVRQGKKTILYELLPPPARLAKSDIERSLSLFSAMLKNFAVDAVNIPEVREETRNGARADASLMKLEPRVVCEYLRKYAQQDVIINRPIVYDAWETQKKWLHDTSSKYHIRNLILVGGESSKLSYPGLSVVAAAEAITKEMPEMLLGGITIPARQNEAKRIAQKSRAGIAFFTTQILYESVTIKRLLKEYWQECQNQEITPKMLFLSFAPVSTPKDAELLKWLGVAIPEETKDVLTTGWLGMGWRSLQICVDILEDILHYVDKENIRVPLGLNIEHVNRHNFEPSFILLERLSEIYLGAHSIERRYPLYD